MYTEMVHWVQGYAVPPYRPRQRQPLGKDHLSVCTDLHSSVYRKLEIGSSFHPHLTHLFNPCGDLLPDVQRAPMLKIIARIR